MSSYTLTTGDDTVPGTSGDDTVTAMADTLTSGDRLTGGAGTDTLVLDGSGFFRIDQLAAFSGFETISLSGSANLYLGSQTISVNKIDTAFASVHLGSGAATLHLDSGTFVTSSSSAAWNRANVIDGGILTLNSDSTPDAIYDLTTNTLTTASVQGRGDSLTLQITSTTAVHVDRFYTFDDSSRLTTASGALDLSNTSVSGFTVTSTNTHGTTFTVADLETAGRVTGGTGADTLVAEGFTFTPEQRNRIFATTSVETIRDASGTYTVLPNLSVATVDVDTNGGKLTITGTTDVKPGT